MFRRSLVRAMQPYHQPPCYLRKIDCEIFLGDGFIHKPEILSDSEKKDIIHWTHQIEGWPTWKNMWMKYYENTSSKNKQLSRIEYFLDFHPKLMEVINKKITPLASELFGYEAILFKEKINFKLPGAGAFREHQDAPAWTFFNQSQHLTALICIDDMTKENGALEFGNRLYKVYPHPNGILDQEISKNLTWNMVEAKAGDVIFFGNLVPHRSPPNLSKKPRRAMFLTYALKSEGDFRREYFRLKRLEFPPENERIPGKDYSNSKIDIRFNLANPID